MKIPSFRHLLLLGALVLAAIPAQAQMTFWAIDYNNGNSRLYTVSSSTWSATLIGTTGQYLEEIAISPTGQLFATDTSGQLFTLNATTGAATLVGSTGRGNIEALDFNGSTLLGVSLSTSNVLFSIDTSTGAATDLLTFTTTPNSIRDMAVKNSTTLLIRTDGGPTLSSVNLSTGVITSIGQMTGAGSLYGMALAPDGALYGFDSDGSIRSIDLTTGATTLLDSKGSQLWLGATIQAIPEPATYALLALGGGLLLVTVRRRRAGGK